MINSATLWEQFSDWQNITDAYNRARKGKSRKPNAVEYHDNWEENLINLHEHLLHSTWQPLGFTTFPVYEPKERIIEAPIYQDRIIHQALHAITEPEFEKKFIHDSYACRTGKGTHRAVLATQKHLRKCKNSVGRGTVYVLQLDIKGYFHFIDHKVLKAQIKKVIKDKELLKVWWKIIDIGGENSVGQPIGALTSQLNANIYKNDTDHYLKDQLGYKHYVRYMDDFLIIHPCKAELAALQKHLEQWLMDNLKLELSKWSIYPDSEGIDFAGYRIWATHIKPRKRNVRNAIKRLRAQYKRKDYKAYKASLASFKGYIKHCSNSDHYMQHVIKVSTCIPHTYKPKL